MKCPLAEKGCGGCRELTRMYGDVLHEKDAPFRALFPDALPILGMAEPRAYRNKVLRTFANGKSGLYHGIYRAGTHQVISVRRCLMENERANEIANIALSLLAETGLSAYREDFHRGILRHMQVRRAHSTGQALVTIVTGTADFPGGEAFARRLMARCPDVRGVTQSINDRDTSAVMGFRSRVLAGRDEIWDELGGLKVCLTARSFYQINTVQAEKLYQRAIDLAQLTPGDRVLDAYCGVGLIGMLAARRAGQVRGVELVRDAVACAQNGCARQPHFKHRFHLRGCGQCPAGRRFCAHGGLCRSPARRLRRALPALPQPGRARAYRLCFLLPRNAAPRRGYPAKSRLCPAIRPARRSLSLYRAYRGGGTAKQSKRRAGGRDARRKAALI